MLFSYYGIGGAQRRAANVAEYLSNHNFKVYLVAVFGSNNSFEQSDFFDVNSKIEIVLLPEWVNTTADNSVKSVIEHENNRIHSLKRKQRFFSFLNISDKDLSYIIPSIRNSIHLKAFLSQHRDAIIINFGFNIFDISYFAHYKTNRIIYVETNSSEKYRNERYYSKILEHIKDSDGRIYQTACEMQEQGIENDFNSVVIHNPLNEKLPMPYTGIRRKVIVNFCALKRQKNLLLLIKAFEQVYRIHNDYELHLFCIGNDYDSAYAVELRSYIEEHKLSENVKLLSMRNDIHDVIKDCSMFVSSSDYEGISNSMIEAMAIGLPCVCTDCAGGGASEMIIDGVNGLLSPVGDATLLSQNILRFIDNPGFAEKCGNNASQLKNELSSSLIYSKWLDFINYIA